MNRIFGPFVDGYPSLGLLVIRIFFGLGLVEHGFQKIQTGPLHWGDDLATMPVHLVIPSFFQGLATFAEFGGGLAMIFGLLTPLAMLGIICTMGFAILKFHFPRGAVYVFTPGKPDYEPAAHYLIVAAGLLLTGPGVLSLDALIFGRHRRAAPAFTP